VANYQDNINPGLSRVITMTTPTASWCDWCQFGTWTWMMIQSRLYMSLPLKRYVFAVLHPFMIIKLRSWSISLPKDYQGHPFKPSTLPSMGVWDSICASWRKQCKQDLWWFQHLTYAYGWSLMCERDGASTHQMLRKLSLSSFVRAHGLWNVGTCTWLPWHDSTHLFWDLRTSVPLELSKANWESIKLVASWLKIVSICDNGDVHNQSRQLLLTTHAIFQGLQDDIKMILHSLPNSVLPQI